MTTAIPSTCQMCGLPIAGFPWWVQARPYHANCIDPPRTYEAARSPLLVTRSLDDLIRLRDELDAQIAAANKVRTGK